MNGKTSRGLSVRLASILATQLYVTPTPEYPFYDPLDENDLSHTPPHHKNRRVASRGDKVTRKGSKKKPATAKSKRRKRRLKS